MDFLKDIDFKDPKVIVGLLVVAYLIYHFFIKDEDEDEDKEAEVDKTKKPIRCDSSDDCKNAGSSKEPLANCCNGVCNTYWSTACKTGTDPDRLGCSEGEYYDKESQKKMKAAKGNKWAVKYCKPKVEAEKKAKVEAEKKAKAKAKAKEEAKPKEEAKAKEAAKIKKK